MDESRRPDPRSDGPDPFGGPQDLGVLRLARASDEALVFAAPGPATRLVWLLGLGGCLVFLWSVTVSLGWLEPRPGGGLAWGRWPTLFETVYWLPPLLLGALSLSLALGGVRVRVTADALELRASWPGRAERQLPLERLVSARFWSETTRSGEALYGVRFGFASGPVVLRTAHRGAWQRLRDRFERGGRR